jgi:RimJ/RimL family protein N-acetyltransferase
VDTLSGMSSELPRFRPPVDPRPDDAPWPQMTWPPAPDTELIGSTVRLRPYTPDDATELFHTLDEARVWALIGPRPRSAEQLAERIAAHARPSDLGRATADPGRGLSAGSVVGMTSFLGVSTYDARLEIGSTSYSTTVWGTRVNRRPSCCCSRTRSTSWARDACS